MDEKKIAELKAAHGELICVESRRGPLVFRRPSRAEYDRWHDQTRHDPENASRHAREIAKCTRVYPDEAGLDAAIDDQPALLCREILDAITSLAGLGADRAHVKKL